MERHQAASSKMDRKTIERNRRKHIKTLYSELNSLLPNQHSKEAVTLPDQLDEALNYIKKLQKKMERLKERKEKIRKSMRSGMMVGLRTPQIEIHDLGSALDVSLISGFDSQFMFYEIIRVLQEEGAAIVNASFSVVDGTFFHTIHSEIGESTLGIGAARISKRLKKYVHEFQAL